jgi:hypothetical protein
MDDMSEQPIVSPFSRPPAPPRTFTRPAPPRPIAAPRPIVAPKPAGPVEMVENLPMGFMAGLVAAALGAGIWALVTVLTGFQIGWMAVGVGFLVGYAVRAAGRGAHVTFGIMGAVLALGGCAAGNLLTVVVLAARHFHVPVLHVFSRLTPRVVESLMVATFKPLDVLFYAIALYEGYRFSIRGHAR